MLRSWLISLLVVLQLAAAACTATADEAEPAAQRTPAQTTTGAATEPAPADTTEDPQDDTEKNEDGSVSLVEAERLVQADLAARLDAPLEEIETVEAVARTWPDETLGCGSRRTVVESLPIDGYHIILTDGEVTFDYRADQHGSFKLCPDTEDIGKPIDPIR